MKNKKGFTLIELLAVVIVLAILLGVAVPSITKYLKKGTQEYYYSIEKEIKASGMDYLETYRTLLPRQIGNVAVITLDELINNKYIDEVKDEDGNSCTGQITAKKVDTGKYEYYSCLKCGDFYESKGDACDYKETNNTYVDSHLYTIEVEKDKYVVNQTEKFELPLGKVYYNDELINDKLEPSPDKINTNVLGTTEVIYFYNGAKKIVTVEVIDGTKPSKTEVVLKKEDKNGSSYLPTTWYSGNIYQEFKSTDYTTPGILGSGIKEYQISTDGINFNKINGNNRVDSENGIHKYYVRSVDKNDNISNTNNYTLKIDKVEPECELKVTSGTEGLNGWYTSDITVTMTTKDNPTGVENSGIFSQGFVYGNTTYTDSVTITANTKSTTINGTVTDNAGNIGVCSITVKIDKDKPTCSWSGENTTWTSSSKTITATCNDNISECTSGTASKSWAYTSGTTSTASLSYTITDKAGNSDTCSKSANVYVDKTAPTAPTSGAIGGVSGSSTTGTIQTAAGGSTDTGGSGNITYRYLVTNSSSTPANTNSGFTTSRNFTRSCGTSYYAWAIAIDKVGNKSAVKYLGATSDGANSYSGWGNCSKSCGGGVQYRTNSCALVTTGLSQSCNTHQCSYAASCGSWSCILYKSCTIYSCNKPLYTIKVGSKCHKQFKTVDACQSACGNSTCKSTTTDSGSAWWCDSQYVAASSTSGRQSECGSETVYGWDNCKNANSLKCDYYTCPSGGSLSGTTCYY